MATWTEVADGVFQCRYQPFDVTVAVVRGADGLLVVDTRGSHRQGVELQSDLARLGGPIRYVVNTHGHFDHTYGNDCFGLTAQPPVPIYGHERVPAHMRCFGGEALATRDPELDDTVLTPPTELVGDRGRLDLGGRAVELVHTGRGHTDNDLALQVVDAGVWLVGDLLEESGPPMCGADGFPLEWPDTLRALLELVRDDDVLVPGHGAVVDRAFAVAQQRELAAVEAVIRDLYRTGVPVADALVAGAGRWPFPVAGLSDAVRRGYAHLAG